MLGFRRLKGRYRRFRHKMQMRFPRLSGILNVVKLPFQLLAVALPLWIAVGFYNGNYSFEAKHRNNGLTSVLNQSPSPEDESASKAIVAISRSAPVEGSGDQADADDTLTDASPVTTPHTESGLEGNRPELLADDGNNVVVKPVTFAPIKELRNDGSVATLEFPSGAGKVSEVAASTEQLSGPAIIHQTPVETSAQPQVRDVAWLADQDDSSFVIQLESSANHEIMQQQALEYSASERLAIYPSALSDSGDVIYGMSYGLYNTLEQAKRASEKLPADLVRFGTWVRQVGTLKRQMQLVNSK